MGSDGGGSALRSGPRLAERMARRVPDLARRAVEQITVEVPLYRVLPREQLDGEILDVVTENIRLFLRAFQKDRPPTSGELTGVLASAARRAEEGVPLADLLAAYHVGARLSWLDLMEVAGRGDEELPAAGVSLLRYMQEVTSAVSTVYLEVQQAIHSEARVARQQLTSALLAGQPTDLLVERAGARVAPAYVALMLALPGPEVDPRAGAGSAVAERRRIRWLQDALDDFAGAPVLSVLDGHGGAALLPATPATVHEVDHTLPVLLVRLAEATGVPVHAASAQAATPAAVPAEARLAGEVLELVQRLARPPGLYRLSDLLVEYQLTRPGPAHDALACRLDGIADQPHLIATLRAYLGHDRRRSRVADALHIHPNTVDYRLGRIAALTGLDPAKPSDGQILMAALLVRDPPAPPGRRGGSPDR
jgi:hypothetical protein